MHLLRSELARWRESGKTARFWLRDDDAVAVTPSLQRLQGVAERYRIPIGLAVIPGLMQPELISYLSHSTASFVAMCHGWRHEDHELGSEPSEFGPGRLTANVRADLGAAFNGFRSHFPSLPVVFVPPFNRICESASTLLGEIGFAGFSAGSRPIERRLTRLAAAAPWLPSLPHSARPGLPRVDAQIDLIDWKTRSARDVSEVERTLVGALRVRRFGMIRADTPIGLLTHHLVHDEPIWSLLERVLELLRSETQLSWPNVADQMREAGSMQAVRQSVGTPNLDEARVSPE